MKSLHLFLVGFSTVISCIVLAGYMDDLGLRNLMGDIPTAVFVAVAGLVMMYQSMKSTRRYRSRRRY